MFDRDARRSHLLVVRLVLRRVVPLPCEVRGVRALVEAGLGPVVVVVVDHRHAPRPRRRRRAPHQLGEEVVVGAIRREEGAPQRRAAPDELAAAHLEHAHLGVWLRRRIPIVVESHRRGAVRRRARRAAAASGGRGGGGGRGARARRGAAAAGGGAQLGVEYVRTVVHGAARLARGRGRALLPAHQPVEVHVAAVVGRVRELGLEV